MRTGCILFACGVACLIYSPVLPPAHIAWLIPFFVILALRFSVLKWPVCFACGLLWAIFRADIILQDSLDPELESRILIAEGVIRSLPLELNKAQRFVFDISKLTDEKGFKHAHPDKVRLSWYYPPSELIPGDHWRLAVKLKRAHGFVNPAGFDYESWLFQQGITATGYVSNKPANLRLLQGNNYYFQRLRYEMREKLHSVLDIRSGATLVPALVLGDRSSISIERWKILTSTGTSHLLAISGLHIGLIAGMVFFLTRWFWPLAYFSALALPAPKAASIAAITAAFCYAAMAGFSVPTQRALIMLTLLLATNFMSCKVNHSSIITLALLIVLIIDPFALLSAGFWLSFSAIIIISYGMSARVGSTGLWWRWGRVQYIVAVGLFPLLAFWFQQIPLTSILANLIVVPWVSFICVPLVLVGSLLLYLNSGLGELVLKTGVESIDLFWPVLELLAATDFSLLRLAQPNLVALLAAITGVLILLMPKGLAGRWLGLFWLLPLLFPVPHKVDMGNARLTLLDVGQGLAAVIETRNHVLLFDSGPRFSSRFDAGSAVIVPHLRKKKLNVVDLLVLSHGDNDHIGGLTEILKQVSVKKILTSVPDQVHHKRTEECWNGQSWDWDGVLFEVLHPHKSSQLLGNDRSCVLKVSAGQYSILLTGDIEAKAEKRILRRNREELSSTILIAPHHGSLSSSTLKFVSAVQAKYVLFPVGYRNRFGFPKQDIIQCYQEGGVQIMDTARDGAIEMRIGAEDVTIRRYRQYQRRFWHMTK